MNTDTHSPKTVFVKIQNTHSALLLTLYFFLFIPAVILTMYLEITGKKIMEALWIGIIWFPIVFLFWQSTQKQILISKEKIQIKPYFWNSWESIPIHPNQVLYLTWSQELNLYKSNLVKQSEFIFLPWRPPPEKQKDNPFNSGFILNLYLCDLPWTQTPETLPITGTLITSLSLKKGCSQGIKMRNLGKIIAKTAGIALVDLSRSENPIKINPEDLDLPFYQKVLKYPNLMQNSQAQLLPSRIKVKQDKTGNKQLTWELPMFHSIRTVGALFAFILLTVFTYPFNNESRFLSPSNLHHLLYFTALVTGLMFLWGGFQFKLSFFSNYLRFSTYFYFLQIQSSTLLYKEITDITLTNDNIEIISKEKEIVIPYQYFSFLYNSKLNLQFLRIIQSEILVRS